MCVICLGTVDMTVVYVSNVNMPEVGFYVGDGGDGVNVIMSIVCLDSVNTFNVPMQRR